MAQNWWEQDEQVAPQGGGVVTRAGDPTIPFRTTQERFQAEASTYAPVKTEAETRQARYKAETDPVYDRAGAIRDWTSDIRSDKRITTYESALPIWASALRAPPTPEGDTLLTNAFAKTLDPLTGVQQGESQQLSGSAPTLEQVKARLMKEFGGEGGQFTDAGRRRIKLALTARMRELADQYRFAREDWRRRLETAGLPDVRPEDILGQPAGIPFQQAEADFLGRPVRNLDGTTGPMPSGFDLADTPGAQRTWIPQGGPEGLAVDVTDYGRLPGETDEQYVARSERLNAEAAARRQSELLQGVRGSGGLGEGVDAFIRGVADIPTFGFADEIAAAGNTIFGGGTMAENLERERAIDAYDMANNPILRFSGQLGGGILLPAVRMNTLGRAAGTSGAIGAGYGLGAGEGDITDRLTSAAEGGAAGAALGGGLFGAATGVNALRGMRAARRQAPPPLVDPATGRLNEPLEALTPGQRVAAARGYGIDLPLGAATDRGGAILERGLDVLPGSAGVMNDARRVVERQVGDALEGVANRYGTSRTMYDGGSALRESGKNWITRFERVSGKAYDAIPVSDKAPAALNTTRATLQQLTSRFESNPELQAALRSAKLEQYQAALEGRGLSWRDLKDFRSRIGYEIGEQRFSDSPTKDDLRALYAALSEDMRATAAAQGPRALRAFERANTLYAQGQQRIESALVSILGDDAMRNPEAAAAVVQKIAQSGGKGGNLDQLRQIRASTIKDGGWDEVSGTLIRLMGQPTKSEGRQFNPQTFVQNYADMSEEARSLLFSGGNRAELRKALDGFVAVSQRLAGTTALRNTSQTTPNWTGAMTQGGVGGTLVLAALDPLKALMAGMTMAGVGAANYATAKLWTNPAFVRWATGYARAVGNQSALRSQAGRLRRLATTNPEIRDEVEALAGSLLPDSERDPRREQR